MNRIINMFRSKPPDGTYEDAMRREAFAQALRERAMTPRGPAVGGPVQAQYGIGEGLIQLAEALLARRAGKSAIEAKKMADMQQTQRNDETLRTMLPPTTMQTQRYAANGSGPIGSVGTIDNLQPEALSMALRGQDPQAIGKFLAERQLQSLLPDPAIAAEQEFKKWQMQETLRGQKERAEEANEARRDAARMAAESRIDAARIAANARRDTASAKPSDTPPGLRLKQGEVWDPESQTVRFIEGSAEYQKQKSKFTEARNVAKKSIEQAKNVSDTIQKILDSPGFSANFGGYNALATQFVPRDDVAFVRNNLAKIKANMKNYGLDLMRARGSIGTITEREWPILEQMIENINPTLGEKDARNALLEFKSALESTARRIQEAFEDEYANSQFMQEASGAQMPGDSPPPGIEPDIWGAMTPEEKALWKKN